MGFQRSKRSRGGGGGSGQFEFRRSLEQFKSDTGVKNENDAVQLMALVNKNVIERSDLIEAVQARPPREVLKALQQID
jgi:hypothetical protein